VEASAILTTAVGGDAGKIPTVASAVASAVDVESATMALGLPLRLDKRLF
jgi:hypothetical protein